MPVEWTIKNPQTSQKKVDRLLEKILDNASKDRDEAKTLLSKSKEVLSEVDGPHTTEEGIVTVDSITKSIQTAIIALNQMGKANEMLLKLATLIQKITTVSSEKKAGKLLSDGGSLFSKIEQLAKSNKDQEDD